jgi:hypothetical protein
MLVPAVMGIKRQWAAVVPKSQFRLLNEVRGLVPVGLSDRYCPAQQMLKAIPISLPHVALMTGRAPRVRFP